MNYQTHLVVQEGLAVPENSYKSKMIEEKLKKWIKETLGREDFTFVRPKNADNGDFSLISNPKTAKEDLDKLKNNLPQEVLKIKFIEPRFINFFLSNKFFADSVKNVLENKDFGVNKNLKGQKTIIEYTDPNPFKEFHIGHLMPNVIGEAIARVLEANGAEIRRANYQGDVGLHVAKAVWAIMKNNTPIFEAYAYGHKAYEEDESAKQEILELNTHIYRHDDKLVDEVYYNGRKISLDYFEKIYKRLGTKFDLYFFESEVAEFGKEIVEKNTGTIFEKSDGAVVFKGENYDKKLHTRVFINKEGLPTYEAKELGLAKIKHDKYSYEASVVVTGNEIKEYFKVLLKAMSLVFPDLAQKTIHLSHGMLRLPHGKMSSRTGNVITAESLIDQIKTKILEKINDDGIAEIIAIGAIKYSILRQAIGGDIIFDFDKSISFEGDSGPYLQYSAVRANSLLQKAEGVVKISSSLPENWELTNLERYLERFGSAVSRAGGEYAPHYLVTYLVELAGEFNSFYANHKIIPARPDDSGRSGGDVEDKTSGYRLALTKAFIEVMSSGLDLLGIRIPEKM